MAHRAKELTLWSVAVVTGIAAYAVTRPRAAPPIPASICTDDSGAPSVPVRPHVVAVIGALDDTTPQFATRAALVEAARTHPMIDFTIIGPLDDRDAIDRALAMPADVLYYNGHAYDGHLAMNIHASIAVLDSCWSTQHYSERLSATTTVIGNSERAVTGSVESFVAFLDGAIVARPWSAILADMNASAAHRANARLLVSKFGAAEHYRRDVACSSPLARR